MFEMDLPDIAQSLDFTCGAACFESMYQYFYGKPCGELYFAKQLGTMELGYTAPESIVKLARYYGLLSELKHSAELSDLVEAISRGAVVFVTWWDEDAGHYSLVKKIDEDSILLMDPWTARNLSDNCVALESFLSNWKLRGAKMISVRSSPR